MKTRKPLKLITLLLVFSLMAGFVTPVNTTEKSQAATLYGKKLKKLKKNKLKIGSTKVFNAALKTYSKVFNNSHKLVPGGIFKTPQTVNAKVKVKVGKVMRYKTKNKVLFNCKVEFANNPTIQTNAISGAFDFIIGDWYRPLSAFVVFDYSTGKSLEDKFIAKKAGVTVKTKKWKHQYYPKQKFKAKYYEDTTYSDYWIRNEKSSTFSFTVTYPKKYKNACVGVGTYAGLAGMDTWGDSYYDKWDYWDSNGRMRWGKAQQYKKGHFAYIRLPG